MDVRGRERGAGLQPARRRQVANLPHVLEDRAGPVLRLTFTHKYTKFVVLSEPENLCFCCDLPCRSLHDTICNLLKAIGLRHLFARVGSAAPARLGIDFTK